MTSLEVREQGELAMEAMLAAYHDDGPAAEETINTLCGKYGWPGMGNVVFGWINMAQEHHGLSRNPDDGGGFLGLLGFDRETGEPVSVEETGAPPHLLAALRLFTLWGNGDKKMAMEVFRQAVSDGHGDDVVSAVLAVTLEMMRPELDRLISSGN